MNSRLRRRHRQLFLGLSLFLPIATGAALWSRRPPIDSLDTPQVLRRASRPLGSELLWERADLWPELGLLTRLFRSEDGLWIELSAKSSLHQPELLLYWHPVTSSGLEQPGPDSLRLGEFSGLRTAFRPPQDRTGGEFFLFSLAHRKIVDRTQMPSLEGKR